MLVLAFNVGLVHAQSETVYINADGSITPAGAPIVTSDNITYTFTGNVTSSGDGVIINRDNITLDGAGYAIEGAGSGAGICLEYRSNVTIKNVEITTFSYGILVLYSSGNSILGNTVTNNGVSGIHLALYSTNNSILANRESDNTYGISLLYSANNSIGNNIVTSNFGIGIDLYSSSSVGNIVFGNNLTDNGDGISVGGPNNTLIGNNIVQSSRYGILLAGVSNNTLRSNSMSDCKFNFAVWGIIPNDVDATNTVNGKPIYYWVNKQDMTVPPNAGYIALMNCARITVKNQNLANSNEVELDLANTTDSLVTENNITAKMWGILLNSSNNNTITENTLTCGSLGVGVGIYFFGSSNNRIFHNSFLDGTLVLFNQGNNIFDNGYPSGGNFWSDYRTRYSNASEIDSSGIWNTPYVIDANNTDNYPLMEPYGTPYGMFYEVTVTNITVCTMYNPTYVYQGWTANITVTIWDNGDYPENVNVALYYNVTANQIVGTQDVTMLAGENDTLLFVWNTAGVPCYTNYTLTAVATIPTGTNTLSDGNITVRILGDITGTGTVDISDISIAAQAFGSHPGMPNWNPAADVNGDGVVDIMDIALIASNFGQHSP
jgi:parallel beta-helix repeat protein